MTVSRQAIVTGAAGFIGSHMVDLLLNEGYYVRALDNLSVGRIENLSHCINDSRLDFEQIDLKCLDPNSPLFSNVEYVFHFAGIGDIVPSIERPIMYLDSNVMGTIHVLEAARFAGVRKFVFAASSSCYGLANELPTTEKSTIDLRYPYALSKYFGEQAVMHWGSTYKLPVVSIRIFNAFGTRSRTTGSYGAVFGVFLAQKLAGRPFTVVGDGTQSRDFIYVTDLTRAFLAAAKSDRIDEIYNVGSGSPKTVNELVSLLEGEVDYLPERPGEPDCTWADISKIKDHLGWKPEVTFEQGVAEMIRNIDYWRDAPVWDSASIDVATKAWFEVLSEENK